jgi:hypothetical protein
MDPVKSPFAEGWNRATPEHPAIAGERASPLPRGTLRRGGRFRRKVGARWGNVGQLPGRGQFGSPVTRRRGYVLLAEANLRGHVCGAGVSQEECCSLWAGPILPGSEQSTSGGVFRPNPTHQ